MFSKLKKWMWMDGNIVPSENAQIHSISHGLHYASCVFEGIRAYGGKIFKGPEHYARFEKSAQLLNFNIPYKAQDLLNITKDLVERNELTKTDIYIRPVAWCGENAMKVSTNNMDVHVAIGMWPWTFGPAHFDHDISLNISPWRRPDPKSSPFQSKAAGLYMISSLAKSDSENKGFDDALMLDCSGKIAESTVSNVFFVKEDVLYTPLPYCFLDGITRKTVIEIAKDLGIKVVETSIFLDDLATFSDCFLTGTALEIKRVRQITLQILEAESAQEQVWTFSPSPTLRRIFDQFHQIKMNG